MAVAIIAIEESLARYEQMAEDGIWDSECDEEWAIKAQTALKYKKLTRFRVGNLRKDMIAKERHAQRKADRQHRAALEMERHEQKVRLKREAIEREQADAEARRATRHAASQQSKKSQFHKTFLQYIKDQVGEEQMQAWASEFKPVWADLRHSEHAIPHPESAAQI